MNPAALKWATDNAPPFDKEVAELTSEEKLALYILAGGEIVEEDTTVRTRRRFGIYKSQGRFRVIIEGNGEPQGQRILFKVKHSTAA